MMKIYFFFKRLLDLAICVISLPLFLPIILIISFLSLFILGRPILFFQERVGYKNKIFMIVKFRTMQNDNGYKKLNIYGRFLRRSSLDELPEIWNIIKGEMSFVGPRPLLKDYIPLYNKNQIKRHNVKPGLTGWAQINGRNNIGWEKKLELDSWYAENANFILDLKIIYKTFYKVLVLENVTDDEEKFKGN